MDDEDAGALRIVGALLAGMGVLVAGASVRRWRWPSSLGGALIRL